MTDIAKDLKGRLANLEEKDRAELALFLIRSLHRDTDPGAGDASRDDIDSRIEEIDSGQEPGIDADELMAELRLKHS